ncbi:hypothetical protein CEE37_09065 [candidate division LCP-89 bacterium B3_LCP]|uniref:MobA-like NTP transferase domain-containing protein n=1 Tax=candidate division LCP-89 bacterium B3_LCP TaxID=2012998 RepID=A0A532UZR5_UNCL8|nr:MAG: hypothetical protein CEE37_09065 [candidate division LCP-89 bacterium B3_LCP]
MKPFNRHCEESRSSGMTKQSHTKSITGYILAGGKSSRMGKDKRWLQKDGMTLLERSCNLVESALGNKPIIVGDNFDNDNYYDCEVIPDAAPNKGPLGGLVASLKHCETTWVLILPVDMPDLSVSDLNMLIQAVEEDYDVIAFKSKRGIEPLAALYSAQNLDYWQMRLQAGELSLKGGISQLSLKTVIPTNETSLSNLNAPEDL